MPRKRAAGYVRVSDVRGREGDEFLSPTLQRQAIEEWATAHGFDVVDWYEDLDVSGRTGVHRPDFERMMSDAHAGRFEAVVVYKLTRFGRSVADTARRFEELRQLGVSFVALDADFDTTTATGKALANIMSVIAEMESDRIGEEWRRVHRHRRSLGIAHVPGGCFGYLVDGAAIVGVDETQAPAVRLAFELRSEGHGYGTIAARLEGFRPLRGGDRISPKAIAAWLRRPLYAGLVRLDGELIDGQQEALVSRELWDRVQARHGTGVARRRAGLLSGVLRCHGCGYAMERRGSGDKTLYVCSAYRRANRCESRVAVTASVVEQYVTEVLLLARFVVAEDAADAPAGRVAALEAEQARLDNTLDKLADRADVMTADDFERQYRRIAGKRDANLAELVEARAQLPSSRAPELLDQDGRLSVPWESFDVAERRRIVGELVKRIVVHPHTGKPDSRRGRRFDPSRLRFEWRLPAFFDVYADYLTSAPSGPVTLTADDFHAVPTGELVELLDGVDGAAMGAALGTAGAGSGRGRRNSKRTRQRVSGRRGDAG